jgi:16S rRNA (guanine527-N7)-methyltransferase
VPTKFDVITSRAFADLSDFVNWSGHVLAEGGQFIALKGTAPAEEQERLPEHGKCRKAFGGARAGCGAPPGFHKAETE